MKRKVISLILIASMILSLAACGNGDNKTNGNASNNNSSNNSSSNNNSSDSEYKDELIFGVKNDSETLDPQVQNEGQSERIVKMLYNSLLKFDDDGKVVGDLAKEWSVAEDHVTWTFKLHEGVKFHSGKELTANDVKATYDRAINTKSGLRTTEIIKMFDKVEVVDEYTVNIVTKEPYGPMESLLCNLSLGIMAIEDIDKYGLDLGKKVEAINGTGPYKLLSWERDEELVIEKFDDFFGEKGKIKTITYQVIPEEASRVIALETGEVDVVESVPADELERLSSTEGITVIKKETVGQRLFRFGCNDPIMSKTKVRQAIVHAIDREAIIKALFNGVGYASTAPLSKVTWGYANLGEIKQDQELAKKLLTEAGYPDGFETKIVTGERYTKGTQLAEIIASQLAEIGIKAKIEVWEASALSASWGGITPEEFDQPIFIMGAGPSMRDADGGLRGLYTTTENGLNDRNYGFYSNKEVDECIFNAMKETDPEKRAALYKRAMEILYLEDPTAMWIYDQFSVIASSDKVENITIDGTGVVMFEKATIKK